MKFWKFSVRLAMLMVGISLITGGVLFCGFNWTATNELRASYGSFSIAGAILLATLYVKEDW